MSISRCGATLALLAVCLCAAPRAHAQTLTLDAALARAAERNPLVAAAGRAITAAERHAESLALPTAYSIGAEFENFAGTGALSGASALESTVRLGRVIELGGKRDARAAFGGRAVEIERAASDRQRLDLAAEVRRRFIATLERQSRLEVLQQNVAAAEQVQATVAQWVAAGRNSDADRLQAEVTVLRTRLAAEDAEHEFESARVALASLWGALQPDFERVQGALQSLPPVDTFEALAARLPQTHDQRAFALEAEALDAQRRVAQAGRVPDVSVSMGVRRLQTVGDQAVVLGVSVPLGTARRAALELDRLSAQRAAIDDRREAARLDAYQRLFALYQELQHSRHVAELHRDQMIPKAESALALTRRAYDAGRSNFLLLAQAQQQLADLRAAEIDAAARYHRLLADIERLAATGAAP